MDSYFIVSKISLENADLNKHFVIVCEKFKTNSDTISLEGNLLGIGNTFADAKTIAKTLL